MTTMTTNSMEKTDNELIAEFMGFVMHESQTYGFILQHPDLMGTYQDHTRNNQHGKAMTLEYHTSWDWLMPVVEKIRKVIYWENGRVKFQTFKFDLNLYRDQGSLLMATISISINGESGLQFIEGKGNTAIAATYDAVISFIKWHKLPFRATLNK